MNLWEKAWCLFLMKWPNSESLVPTCDPAPGYEVQRKVIDSQEARMIHRPQNPVCASLCPRANHRKPRGAHSKGLWTVIKSLTMLLDANQESTLLYYKITLSCRLLTKHYLWVFRLNVYSLLVVKPVITDASCNLLKALGTRRFDVW